MSKNSGVVGKTVPQLDRSIRAADRQDQRDAREAEMQLALLDQRPGAALRERARLHRQQVPS